KSFEAVPLLVTISTDGYDSGLERLAKTWNARNLHFEITYPNLDLLSQNRDRDMEAILSIVHADLSEVFQADRDNFEWMRSLEVMRSKTRLESYSVGQTRGRFELPA